MPPTEPRAAGRGRLDELHTSMKAQAVNSTGRAENLNLVTFRKAYDLNQPVEEAALRAELGPDGRIPTDRGVHFLFYVRPLASPKEDDDLALLLPEEAVRWVLFGMGCADSVEAALELSFRPTLLPLDDPDWEPS